MAVSVSCCTRVRHRLLALRPPNLNAEGGGSIDGRSHLVDAEPQSWPSSTQRATPPAAKSNCPEPSCRTLYITIFGISPTASALSSAFQFHGHDLNVRQTIPKICACEPARANAANRILRACLPVANVQAISRTQSSAVVGIETNYSFQFFPARLMLTQLLNS